MNTCRTFDPSKFFGLMGGKKYRIFEFLLKSKNAENQIIITTTELAEKLGVSRDTVSRTLKILKECGAITTRTGVITINPAGVTLGSPRKRNRRKTAKTAPVQKTAKAEPRRQKNSSLDRGADAKSLPTMEELIELGAKKLLDNNMLPSIITPGVRKMMEERGIDIPLFR